MRVLINTRGVVQWSGSIARDALRRLSGQWRIGGGWITAWGETDIDDEESELHERHAVGVHSTNAYHSVDTGKYTLGPHFAEIACDRIAPRKSIAGPGVGRDA